MTYLFSQGPASKSPADVSKVLFCTGKVWRKYAENIDRILRKYFEVYYDLIKERRDRGLEDKIAIHTIEQISPFPFDIMKQVTDEYSNAELFWVQEVSWTCVVSSKNICGRIKNI